MCKGLRITTLTALMTLIAVMLVSVVYAEGSAKTSSFGGVTVSAATDGQQGLVTFTGTNDSGKNLKIWIRKGEGSGNFYSVSDGREINETVSLVEGSGVYNVYIMIHESGNVYSYGPYLEIENTAEENAVQSRTVSSNKSTTEIKDNNYVLPSNDINSYDTDIVELSKKLTEGKKTEREKIEAIYTWVVENITYDYAKYGRMLEKNYTDQFGSLSALETKKGVCYDYATLLAALYRAAGIEAKVDKGYSTNIIGYHAWNEVYDSEKKQWILLDATVDSVDYHNSGSKVTFNEKSADEYYKTGEV